MIGFCEEEAMRHGFKKMELGATLPGVPLYSALGYEPYSQTRVPMPDGEGLEVIRMGKLLGEKA